MSCHLFRCRSDTCKSVDTSIKNFQWAHTYWKVTKVNVSSCSKNSTWFYRKDEVIMHSSLSHDFFTNNYFLLTWVTNLNEFLCIYYKVFFKFLQCFTDFLCDNIKCCMCSHRSTTFHVCLFLNYDITFDKDFSLIWTSRTSPHNVFIHISFGRTELTDLNSTFVCS